MITYDQIKANLAAICTEVNTTSLTNILNKIAKSFSDIIDLFNTEIESTKTTLINDASNLVYGRPGYYTGKALAYQDGDSLVENPSTGAFEYAVIDPDKQIVKKAAFDNLVLKVAFENSTTGKLEGWGDNQAINSIYFISDVIGWYCGLLGIIRYTTNGGDTNTLQTTGTTENLKSIFFISSTVGWCCGENGVILYTSDSGTTWTAQTSTVSTHLNSAFFISATEGWIVGDAGVILYTVDSGTTWTAQTSGTSYDLRSVYFADATTGWICGQFRTILKTVNSGTAWTVQSSISSDQLYSVFFISTSVGWCCGDIGYILYTSNGGTTWTPMAYSVYDLKSIFFISATEGFACGENGSILYTTNSGVTWTKLQGSPSNALSKYTSIFYISGVVYVAGYYDISNSEGIMYKSTDKLHYNEVYISEKRKNFITYNKNYEVVGLPLVYISGSPNIYDFTGTVVYHKNYNATEIKLKVELAFANFRDLFEFNGVLYVQELVNYIISNSDGVIDVQMSSTKIDTVAFSFNTTLSFGYFDYDTNTLANITYNAV